MKLFTKILQVTKVAINFKLAILSILFVGFSHSSFSQTQNAAQAPSSKINDTQKEAQLKATQAKQMKEQCPNHPSFKSSSKSPGVNAELRNEYENWKKNYPSEYAAYLKIFNFKY